MQTTVEILALLLGSGGTFAIWQSWTNRSSRPEKKRAEADTAFNQALANLNTDRPSIHIGALQELDQLGQHEPRYRQRVVDLICGYLRDTSHAAEQGGAQARSLRAARDTCQFILAAHLRPHTEPARGDRRSQHSTFWPDIDLRLMGATLHDLDLSGCRVRSAWFNSTVFTGETRFRSTEFYGPAVFENATFRGEAEFMASSFAHHAWFLNATFHRSANFGSTYTDGQILPGTAFYGNAWFRGANFFTDANFTGTQFSSEWHAAFEDVGFRGAAMFLGASMREGLFHGTKFGASANFHAVKFDKLWFRGAVFYAAVRFAEVGSGEHVYLHSAGLQVSAADLAQCVLPPDWQLRATATPGCYVFVSGWPDDPGFLGVLMSGPPRP